MTEREVRIINGKEVVLYRHKELDSYLFAEDVVDLLLKAFEEVEQYRAIGTVEEFKKYKEELELYRNLDKTNYHDGYRNAIDDVVCKISDYKEKHYHNREEYPINYGLLCDMENWFLEMKGEKQ